MSCNMGVHISVHWSLEKSSQKVALHDTSEHSTVFIYLWTKDSCAITWYILFISFVMKTFYFVSCASLTWTLI